MSYYRFLINLILLFTYSSMTLYSQSYVPILIVNEGASNSQPLTSYDDVLGLIDNLEYGVLENEFSDLDLDKITAFLTMIAKQGVLPNQIEENDILEKDIQDLLNAKDNPDFFGFDDEDNFTIYPAIYYGDGHVFECNFFSKQWRKARNFVKKHKKAIIIGAVIVVAVATLYGIYIATTVAGTGTVGVATSSGENLGSSPSLKDESTPLPPFIDSNSNNPEVVNESPLRSILESQISSFKEHISAESYFPTNDSSLAYGDLSLGEHGRIAGSLFTHESLKNLKVEFPNQPSPTFGHQEIDQRFSTDFTPIFANNEKETFKSILYQTRGEKALQEGFFDLALHDFSKAVEFDPTTPIPYLERGVAYFEIGDYDQSLQDFHNYTSLKPTNPLSAPEFVLGFYNGISKGIYKSGEGMFLFLADFVKHPLNTSQQILESLSLLCDLANNLQWEVLGEVLVPEVFQLIKEWDTLPSNERGELAGVAFGKHGSDIFIPGAISKAMSSGMKGMQELGSVWKSLQAAEKTLFLESLATAGDTAKFAEIIQSSKITISIGEDLGFSYKQMARLKEAGTLDTIINGHFQRVQKDYFWQNSYKITKNAEEFLKPYCKRYMPEVKIRELIHHTGIRTYPRPKGIPENYRTQISKDGAGMLYVHPEHEHTSIRVMPGKPYSPFHYQREPYVKQIIDGNTIDIFGNIIEGSAPEAHIPLKKFRYKEKINGINRRK